MSPWLTAVVSLVGLCIGAGVAVAGAVYKEPTLTQLGSTIVGGALGMFVPSVKMPGHHQPAQRRRDTGKLPTVGGE